MDAINTILAPTDLSESSVRGLRYALELAASVKARVIIFHAARYEDEFPYPLGMGDVPAAYVPPQSFDEFLRERSQALYRFVDDHLQDLLNDVQCSVELDVGDADELIVSKAGECDADLIVMSTHGRSGLEHILIGSVTEHVIRRARCPVLSIRSQQEA